MEICKNKESGMYFIYIEDTPDDKLLLVTPSAEIKTLDPSLFDLPEERTKEEIVSIGLLKEKQIKRYKDFIENESIEILHREMKYEEDKSYALINAKEKMCNKQWEFIMDRFETLKPDLDQETDEKH